MHTRHHANLVGALALLFLLTPALANAAIARDNSAVGSVGAAVTRTDSYTVGASATLLVVFHVYNTDSDTNTDITATWNGTNMTQITGLNSVPAMLGCSGGTCYRMSGWYMTNPTTGTHDVVTGTTGSEFQQAYIYSYNGTKTDASVIDAANTSSTASDVTLLSSNITVVAANSWIAALGVNNAGAPTTATGVVSTLTTNGSMASIMLDSNGAVSAGSNAYGFSGAPAGSSGVFAVSIAPAADATLLTPIIGLVRAFWSW
jgi:hypothetical protein